MTNGSSPRQGWSQAHIDIGALAQRVTGLENAIGNVGEQLRDISKRLDSKPTDIWKIVGGIVGILALVGAFLLQGKAYIDADLDRQERDISHILDTSVSKDDFRRSQDGQDSWLANLRDRARADEEIINVDRIALARLEGATTERHETYLRDHAALMARVDSIDSSLIKRPEIEAALLSQRELTTLTNAASNSRIDAVIGSLNELRHDFGANFTLGDAVKEIQLRMNALQLLPAFSPKPADAPR